MHAKCLILALAVYLQCEAALGQRVWVSPQTTAQEMRNPYTWYRPYYQAAGEAYAKYYQNAREITAQLYQQAYASGAWGNGSGGGSGGNVNPTVNPNQAMNPNQQMNPNQSMNPQQGNQNWG